LIFPNKSIGKKDIYLREVNESLNEIGLESDLVLIRDILNYWAQVNCIRKERVDRTNNQYRIFLNISFDKFKENLENRLKVADACLMVFEQKYLENAKPDENFSDKKLISFSVLDLKKAAELLITEDHPIRFYEFILLYFHHLKILELKDGLMVFYNPMKITRENDNTLKQYTKKDYEQLAQHYKSKTEQIHIVGEYAKKQLENNIIATQFVEDYFSLPYVDFLSRYFSKRKTNIRQPITEKKFKKIFSELSTEQAIIVKDKNYKILVAAGPGSGKTRVLVHKVASLLLIEDIKSEQFLMLTFSRPAALEFKNRLKALVGTIAYQVDIFTYHGFAFQLAGRMGDIEKSQGIIAKITKEIEQEEIPLDRIQNKSVIVIDEYQDVSQEEYDFIMAIIRVAGDIRVIVVGDDDQNIYEFRGSSIQYMRDFESHQNAVTYYLTINYRSKNNLLEFSNLFLNTHFTSERIKHNVPLTSYDQRNGVIEIIKYSSPNLILPLIEHLKSKALKGTTAVLTHTNEESVLITSLLKKEGFPASLISDKQGFSLRGLLEIKTFTHFIFKDIQNDFGLISDDKWEESKSRLFELYISSRNLDLVQRVIWKSYLKEIRVEDFYHADKDKILVSTMHKSKGKEFDNVFVLLNNYPLQSEERKRVLYVAITRAKDNLFVHTNNVDFSREKIAALEYKIDNNLYPEPDTLILECGMKDIHLGFFKSEEISYYIKQLKSGDLLFPTDGHSIFEDKNKNPVCKFSQKMEARYKDYLTKGYQFKSAVAKYIVVWYDEDRDRSYRVVLGEVVLEKTEPR
jgi:ATP-dependent DNA helicase RecQ